MKKRVAIVLLVGILVAQPVFASDVGFTDTGPVPDTPASLEGDVRVERPFHQNTSVTQIHSSTNTKWMIDINHRGTANRTYLINKKSVSVFKETDNVTLYVDGKRTEYDTIQALNKTWMRFNVSGNNPRFKIVPSQLAGGSSGGWLEQIRLIFLDNPVTILMGIGVILLVVFSVISSVMSSEGVVEWIE